MEKKCFLADKQLTISSPIPGKLQSFEHLDTGVFNRHAATHLCNATQTVGGTDLMTVKMRLCSDDNIERVRQRSVTEG